MATAKLRGFKGHLTRAEKELDRICSFVEDNSSPRGISELETSFTKFKHAYSKLEILFDELTVSEIDDKVVDGYEGQLAEYSSKIDVYTKRVLHIIGGSRQVPNSQEGSTTSTSIRTDAPVYKPKICETLKPFKLNNVHTPVDLRNWIAKFKAFHSISNLELYTIEEQHMFLLSCVDPKLETTIVEHDNYKAELHLFGDDSVITILRDIFDLSFPLFNRRLEFFRYTQASGQKFSDFMLTLKQKGEDDDLHSLDIDTVYVFRYLTGTNDTILRDRFLKLENPNLKQLKQEVRSYEAGLQAARAMDEDINISKFVGQRKNKTPYHKSKLKHFEAKTYNQAPIPIEMKELVVNNHTINAIVSSEIYDEMLISWHNLRSLKIITNDFPCIVRSHTTSHSNLTINDVITNLRNEYSDILNNSLEPNTFMKGPPMVIHLRTDISIKPKHHLTARKVPLHFQKGADDCIKKLLRLQIIERVDTPTDWVSPGHFVQKPNGTLRLVTDYTNLNEFVKRPVHPFPTGLEIIHSLKNSSKWFAKLDALSGYFQIPLEAESSHLTTFIVPQGRFQYTRAPMGLNASGDEWLGMLSSFVMGNLARGQEEAPLLQLGKIADHMKSKAKEGLSYVIEDSSNRQSESL
ncbi:Transposon Ty3-G Gag-Pol polyprotein [Nymphon striatum]|nr:Transposon Ty3-G Gag-Pol polyprotein [Nymphon striatum]